MPSALPKAKQVKRSFLDRGEAIAKWARENGFKTANVYAVLDGRCKGNRGKAHEIAVALGLKGEPRPSSPEILERKS